MKNYGVISILMGTYNGGKFLRQQLDSIISQTYDNWVLYISDDGSTDNTLDIVSEYANKVPEGKIVVRSGPGTGFANNFLSMLRDPQIISPYYAFCDQDDVWFDSKLEVAINAANAASGQPEKECVLYGSRTHLIDSDGVKSGCSPCFQRAFGLKNALVQSFSGGNTMLFSRALKHIVESFPADTKIVSHDWFLYLVCSAVDGQVIYDTTPQILYRQHGNNLVGSNLGVISKLVRLRKIYSGDFKHWNEMNHRNLNCIKELISPENHKVISSDYHPQDNSALKRATAFIRAGVYRQSSFESMFFMIMAFMGKLR